MSVYLSNTYQSKHGNSCHTSTATPPINHIYIYIEAPIFLCFVFAATTFARCCWHLVKFKDKRLKHFSLIFSILLDFNLNAISMACGVTIKHFSFNFSFLKNYLFIIFYWEDLLKLVLVESINALLYTNFFKICCIHFKKPSQKQANVAEIQYSFVP